MGPNDAETGMTPEQLAETLHEIWTRKVTKPAPEKPIHVYQPAILMPSGNLYPLGNVLIPMQQIIDLRKRVKELETKVQGL